MQPIVTDLVLQILAASSKSLELLYKRIFETAKDFQAELEIARRLENGDTSDLVESKDATGFPHNQVSSQFFSALAEVARQSPIRRTLSQRLDRHLYSADSDRHLRALFATGRFFRREAEDWLKESPDQRTRISALVLHSMLKTRRVIQVEKASTRSHVPEYAIAFVPSPYYIARQLLTDPTSSTSAAYAAAAIRIELLRALENQIGSIDLSHHAIASSLDLMNNRIATSKQIRSGVNRDGTVLFLCHHLAARGILSLQLEWNDQVPSARPDRFFSEAGNILKVDWTKERRGIGLQLSFRLHPDHLELPTAGELLNELHGLPIPLEGAPPLFYDGLRFGSQGEVVAAISGGFGAGKTSVCLSLAASLAPLGCRTLFLSCEEASEDLQARLDEAIPEYVNRSTPLFKCVSFDEIRGWDSPERKWFAAYSVRVSHDKNENRRVEVASQVKSLIEQAINKSELFEPYRNSDPNYPPFARPIVIIDGFHQLFREGGDPSTHFERSLRELIDACRKFRAVFIFTSSSSSPELERLDYLCDLVVELGQRGLHAPEEFAGRVFKILKSRRQPAFIGAHIFHLDGPRSLRIKPSIPFIAHRSNRLRWTEPDSGSKILLEDYSERTYIARYSQTLVYGRGSAGKAGLAMYMLHRRPLTDGNLETRIIKAEDFDFYESRTLVISFLYQAAYYKDLGRRLKVRSQTDGNIFCPDRSQVDVITINPGGIGAEDFLTKIDNQLEAAELRGLPYTGVLIDGLHNIFVQFPHLEKDKMVWPQLYNMLRRRALTVVTTHTEFGLREAGQMGSLSVDFEHAQRKAAPLLSVLISASDFVFELSARTYNNSSANYYVWVRGMLGQEPPRGSFEWNRQQCRPGRWIPEGQLDLFDAENSALLRDAN